jgi:hypothetical protein
MAVDRNGPNEIHSSSELIFQRSYDSARDAALSGTK